jgi:hypothetical protein
MKLQEVLASVQLHSCLSSYFLTPFPHSVPNLFTANTYSEKETPKNQDLGPDWINAYTHALSEEFLVAVKPHLDIFNGPFVFKEE